MGEGGGVGEWNNFYFWTIAISTACCVLKVIGKVEIADANTNEQNT